MDRDPFQEYLKHTEPDKASKGYAWSTAIGLQAVDGLKPSQYLIDADEKSTQCPGTHQDSQKYDIGNRKHHKIVPFFSRYFICNLTIRD